MAMMASGAGGSRSYSYTVTEKYTLEEAIDKVISGGLDPDNVYSQMPHPLQQELDRLAKRQFSNEFSPLSTSQQREVMRSLKEGITEAKSRSEQALSVGEAFKMAMAGTVDDLKLYQALPEELKAVVDALASAHNLANFCAGSPAVRKEILGFIADMLHDGTDGQKSEGELVSQEANRRAALELERKAAGQCLVCGKRLGFVNRMFGRDSHHNCTMARN